MDGHHAASGILVPLATFLTTGIFLFILFCSVRGWFTDIYAPRRRLGRYLTFF
jgi:hypothetical protein